MERRRPILPQDVGQYSPGISRIEAQVSADLMEHDRLCSALERERDDWQKAYSLYRHCVEVATRMAMIGEFRKRSDTLIHISTTAGLMHDVGKLEESCWVYRLNRVLTLQEKAAINKHPDFSGRYVTTALFNVRLEDREYIRKVYPIVRYHHRPWEIVDSELRDIAFDLMFLDCFVSVLENRWRPGLRRHEALVSLEETALELLRGNPRLEAFRDEIIASVAAVEVVNGFRFRAWTFCLRYR